MVILLECQYLKTDCNFSKIMILLIYCTTIQSCQHYLYHGTGYNFEQAESCSGYDTNSEKEPKSNSEDTKRFSEEGINNISYK